MRRQCGGRAVRSDERRADQRPPVQAPRDAKQEIGWSEASAASTVNAFSLLRITSGVVSRGVDQASSQLLLAAGVVRATSGNRFPARSTGGRRSACRSSRFAEEGARRSCCRGEIRAVSWPSSPELPQSPSSPRSRFWKSPRTRTPTRTCSCVRPSSAG